tara:strand:+ start:1825 stop:2469 length:645 start_codon:yes stop_codon:yes gene_type:complete
MRLVGKRVERLNRYGDDLCIELKEKGTMRISPALKSRMDIPNSGNKVGFAYPEPEDEMQQVMMYVAPDGNGVAVNTQGVLNNTPHNRDLRSHYEESGTEDVKLFVAEQYVEIDGFEGYKFFKIKSQTQVHASEIETFVSSQSDEDIIEHAATNECSNPEIEEDVFGEEDQKFQKEVNDIEEKEENDLDFIEKETKVESESKTVVETVEDPDDIW